MTSGMGNSEIVNATFKAASNDQVDLAKILRHDNSKKPQKYFLRNDYGGYGLPNVQSVDCSPIPRAIRGLYAQVECEMFMGLFPAINRAWITIDNRLFLWNYYKGEDFYVYDGLDQLIVSVGLARPRPGVFPDDVQYVLLVSTPVEIILLTVRIIGDQVHGDIHVEPTVFSMPTDNVPMRTIKGTVDGRIFMGGHDGSLYEFVYENPSMLHNLGLKRQCRKIQVSGMFGSAKRLIPSFLRNLAGSSTPLVHLVVDHERHLLYTASESAVLSVYALFSKDREDGQEIRLVGRIDEFTKAVNKFLQNGVNMTGVNKAENLQIESLNVVGRFESESIHLVIVTTFGIRIYLSTRKGKDGETLEIKHIRGPPSTFKRPSTNANTARPGHSSSLLAQNMQQDVSQNVVDDGILPGKNTDRIVSASLYAEGVTLLAFAPPTPSIASNNFTENSNQLQPSSFAGAGTSRQTDHNEHHALCAFSTDTAMRLNINREGFPHEKWSQEPLHEQIDVDILEQGPELMDTQFDNNNTGIRSRFNGGLPVGRVWAIVESQFDPTRPEEELDVFDHMQSKPIGTLVSTQQKQQQPENTENRGGLSGSKRPASDALAAAKDRTSSSSSSPVAQPVPLTELCRQHVLPRRYFYVLTSHGLWVLTKNQPINQFHALLQGPEPETNGPIYDFFYQYALDEGCAMAVAIASKTGFVEGFPTLENQQVDVALNGLKGPFYGRPQSDQALRSSWVAQRAALYFWKMGTMCEQQGQDNMGQHFLPRYKSYQQSIPNFATAQPAGGRTNELIHSGCYTGVQLHFSRLLRPFWDWTVALQPAEAGMPLLRCRWTCEQISILTRPLERLRKFLQTQPPYADAIRESQMVGGKVSKHYRNVELLSPQAAENDMMVNLFELLDRAIQALLLFDILQSSSPSLPFAKLVACADPQVHAMLAKMKWSEMITSKEGKVVACSLVKLLVERSLPEESSSSNLIGRLESQCPSFFSQGDALQISAFEKLAKAERMKKVNPSRAAPLLEDALKLFYDGFQKTNNPIDTKITRTTLTDACDKFEKLGQAEGAVALALHCAKSYTTEPLDRLPDRKPNDPKSVAILEMREFCYDLAMNILTRVLPSSPNDPIEKTGVAGRALQVATTSPDALWHYTLYTWFLENGWKTQLLEISSGFIVNFLKDGRANDPTKAHPSMYESPHHFDIHLTLLVEWFAKHERFADAAKVMQNLAKLDPQSHRHENNPNNTTGPNLTQRQQYFSRAYHYAKTSGVDASPLKDELDVVDLQIHAYAELKESTEMLERMTNIPNNRQNGAAHARDELTDRIQLQSEAMSILETTLKNPSDLYNDFAYRFELWESCIRIMQACDYSDEEELQTMYAKILSETAFRFRKEGKQTVVSELEIKVKELGLKFYERNAQRNALAFPYGYLIHGLEDVNVLYLDSNDTIQNVQERGLVMKSMIHVGVPFLDLFQAYRNYYRDVREGIAPIGVRFLNGCDHGQTDSYYDISKINVAWAIVTLVNFWSSHDGQIITHPEVGDLLEDIKQTISGLSLNDQNQQQVERGELLRRLTSLIDLNHG